MKMQKGENWICSNPKCRSEFVVTAASEPEDGVNPRCCCGSKMKKTYTAPRFWTMQNSDSLQALDRRFQSKVR